MGSYASEIRTLDEVPEPFRGALRQTLEPNERPQFMVLSPAYTRVGNRWPASLLVIAQRRWLLATQARAESAAKLESASFADTLMVRLESVLWSGQLKIDQTGSGAGRTCSARFHAVMEHLYHHAINLLLDGMEAAQSTPPGASGVQIPGMRNWPAKFKSKVPDAVPAGRHLLTAVYWPAVHGLLYRERLPAAALAVTDCDLLLVADGRIWPLLAIVPAYGAFTTYVPLIRMGEIRINSSSEIDTLEVDVQTSGGRTTLKVEFPNGQHEAIREVMDFAMRQRSAVTAGRGSRADLYPHLGK